VWKKKKGFAAWHAPKKEKGKEKRGKRKRMKGTCLAINEATSIVQREIKEGGSSFKPRGGEKELSLPLRKGGLASEWLADIKQESLKAKIGGGGRIGGRYQKKGRRSYNMRGKKKGGEAFE